MASRTLHIYTVVGNTNPFPIDMLRHDRSTPMRKEDAQAITNSHDSFHVAEGGTYSVDLQGVYPPAAKLWQSYGWKVIEHEKVRQEI